MGKIIFEKGGLARRASILHPPSRANKLSSASDARWVTEREKEVPPPGGDTPATPASLTIPESTGAKLVETIVPAPIHESTLLSDIILSS
ncbi:hypothetical protein ASPCADRAFT_212073 [Aspergillus carbonarius ITEM 5010]|uniref:Uncharacterized protein n=1 Tax=Aspergillus carbonarius (strain ITEM 5010) TaxID=602072 RepID=A0A1R3R756_ASPC5|nr:hypothetical protein ASPCADRAFT_212073 [Aspergillus carbonarius ITEM 5010]